MRQLIALIFLVAAVPAVAAEDCASTHEGRDISFPPIVELSQPVSLGS